MVPDYKAATWQECSEMGDDEFIADIWGKQHSIAAFMDRTKVKSYDELQAKLYDVMNLDAEGNAVSVSEKASKTADELLNRMQMASESSIKQTVDDPVEEAKTSEPIEETKTSDPVEEPGGESEMDEFEAMLANMD